METATKNKISANNDSSQILECLKLIIHRLKNIDIELLDPISINKKITELFDLDSLDFMQFISALEAEFNIEFDPDAAYDELNNLEYLVKEIDRKTRQAIKNSINR